uniref:retinol dehydrogenase 12-like isoform X2 n=1 Tax=Myxine glutinosa TaxID=7769 RepID=UPI00358F0DE3
MAFLLLLLGFSALGGLAWLLLPAFRRYVAGGVCTSPARLDGKIVLITGANTGIGKETAWDLARRGARVILACRDVNKAESVAAEIIANTGNTDVVVRKLDLASTASIRDLAAGVNKEESALHVLINNAGVMACPYWKTEDGFEMQIGVNHFGHFLLTYLLLDILKRSSPARIVNVSSVVHKWGHINFDDLQSEKSYNGKSAYCQSKLANVLFTRELARRIHGSDVTANCLHPGVVQTEVIRHIPICQTLMHFVAFWFKTPAEGAQTTIFCAVAPELATVSGIYFSDCVPAAMGSSANDKQAASHLWDISCRQLDIQWD